MSILKPRYIDAHSGATTFAGTWLGPFRGKKDFGFHCSWTGTLTGVFTIEVSGDGPGARPDGNTAVQPSGTLTPAVLVTTATGVLNGSQPAGSPGGCYFNLQNIAAPWLRVRYTATSGAGNVSVGASGGAA